MACGKGNLLIPACGKELRATQGRGQLIEFRNLGNITLVMLLLIQYLLYQTQYDYNNTPMPVKTHESVQGIAYFLVVVVQWVVIIVNSDVRG